jgi:hypothetical protein
MDVRMGMRSRAFRSSGVKRASVIQRATVNG